MGVVVHPAGPQRNADGMAIVGTDGPPTRTPFVECLVYVTHDAVAPAEPLLGRRARFERSVSSGSASPPDTREPGPAEPLVDRVLGQSERRVCGDLVVEGAEDFGDRALGRGSGPIHGMLDGLVNTPQLRNGQPLPPAGSDSPEGSLDRRVTVRSKVQGSGLAASRRGCRVPHASRRHDDVALGFVRRVQSRRSSGVMRLLGDYEQHRRVPMRRCLVSAAAGV